MLVATGRYFAIKSLTTFFMLFVGLLAMAEAPSGKLSERTKARLETLAKNRLNDFEEFFRPWQHIGTINIDSLSLNHSSTLNIYFNSNLTHLPIRHEFIQQLETAIMYHLGRRFKEFDLQLFCRNHPLIDFIPNTFRQPYFEPDTARIRPTPIQYPLVRKTSRGNFADGLSGSHIALWHSHGLYFDNFLNRWQWQRARLFGTVEDLFPMVYVLKYTAPMLENAGAVLMLPRERDFQTHEVVVDLDGSTGHSKLIIHNSENRSWQVMPGGYAHQDTLFDGDNPFRAGNHLKKESGEDNLGSIKYVPDFPEDGAYAVYFSWEHDPLNSTSVESVLNFAGGSERFFLNQTMGGGTWIYLGTFFFKKGQDASIGSFEIFGSDQGPVTADALRFGGGMGHVARRSGAGAVQRGRSADDTGLSARQVNEKPVELFSWKTSERPRFHEGARYYLQFAGMPDTLVYNLNRGNNDYNDDFMSRGEWVNYLVGAPLGPARSPDAIGLNIPIDLALAFHTDAGVTPNDSVIGTLAIYSTQREDGYFRDGVSKLANRDLADLVQSQIVNDIRLLFNENWTRRALWNRLYSEAWRPQVPVMLLELLSHQNLADMRYGLDPRFQFAVSRSIYKALLRFVAANQGRQAIVQPLPPQAMMIEHIEGRRIRISWQPTPDPLEPTAVAKSYMVYKRKEGLGFDTGTRTSNAYFETELAEWNTIYSFRVKAINNGGKSFPSETLSVALVEDQPKTVLVVNAFTRVSGPAVFDKSGMAGHAWWHDQGVPFHFNPAFTGHQFDFDRNSPWLHDDSPGWGASHADMEPLIQKGNTFDFAALHGDAIRNAGYSFVSVSRKAVEENKVDVDGFWAANFIFGEQLGVPHLKTPSEIEFRVFTPELMNWLKKFTEAGGHVLISGAYTGTDMIVHSDSVAIRFAQETLGYTWRTNHAANKPEISVTDEFFAMFPQTVKINTGFHPDFYTVEAPDGIEPASGNSSTLFRYDVNQISAGVVFRGGRHKAVSLGFPFESIIDPTEREELMKSILKFFKRNK
ncbi:MAG TPA: hypothetical protein VLH37_09940 [Bacteroidales bacterium]|nr:hypothetical protein [Bacteroidales bacterium]